MFLRTNLKTIYIHLLTPWYSFIPFFFSFFSLLPQNNNSLPFSAILPKPNRKHLRYIIEFRSLFMFKRMICLCFTSLYKLFYCSAQKILSHPTQEKFTSSSVKQLAVNLVFCTKSSEKIENKQKKKLSGVILVNQRNCLSFFSNEFFCCYAIYRVEWRFLLSPLCWTLHSLLFKEISYKLLVLIFTIITNIVSTNQTSILLRSTLNLKTYRFNKYKQNTAKDKLECVNVLKFVFSRWRSQ
jgi:hypothetical protein